MKKIEELKKLIKSGKIFEKDAKELARWIDDYYKDQGPVTKDDNPPHKPPNP